MIRDRISSIQGQVESENNDTNDNENREMEGIEVAMPSGSSAGEMSTLRDKEERDNIEHSDREAFVIRDGKLIKMSVMSQHDFQELKKHRYVDDHVGKANLIVRLPPELTTMKKGKNAIKSR